RVVLVPDKDDAARRLDNAERRKVVEARNAWHQASRLRVNVLRPCGIFVRRLEVLPQRRGPRLIWDVPVRRIDDEARVAFDDAGYALVELLRAAQGRIERMGAAADRTPCAFDVRLAVDGLGRRPGPRGPVVALPRERDRQ